MFSAVVRVTGAGRLADFRERLRWLLVRDPDAEDYTEHHADGLLEYRFTPRHGLPFPALYPDGYGVDPRTQYPYVVTSRGCPAQCTFCSSPE